MKCSDEDECIDCYPNYYLKDGRCTQPIEHCASFFENKPKCEICTYGYYLDDDECESLSFKNTR